VDWWIYFVVRTELEHLEEQQRRKVIRKHKIYIDMGFNRYYLVPLGILKMLETIFLIVGFSTVVESDLNRGVEIKFHIAICVIAFVLCVVWFLVNIFVNISYNTILKCVVGAFHFILGALVMIASSMVIHMVVTFDGMHNLKTGGAFGILAACCIVIDGFLHLCIKQYYDEEEEEPKKTEEAAEPKA